MSNDTLTPEDLPGFYREIRDFKVSRDKIRARKDELNRIARDDSDFQAMMLAMLILSTHIPEDMEADTAEKLASIDRESDEYQNFQRDMNNGSIVPLVADGGADSFAAADDSSSKIDSAGFDSGSSSSSDSGGYSGGSSCSSGSSCGGGGASCGGGGC